MSALDEAPWPRASLPRRPMLGAVLDALTTWGDGQTPPSEALSRERARATTDESGVFVGAFDGPAAFAISARRCYWITTDPAEAWEILDARGLIPEGYVGRFVCGVCGGRCFTETPVPPFGDIATGPCYACGQVGHRPHPPTVAALASWASLGFAASDDGVPGILGAEELAREVGGEVRWRIAGREPSAPSAFGPTTPMARLTGAGIRWEWQGGAIDRTTLYVPPL